MMSPRTCQSPPPERLSMRPTRWSPSRASDGGKRAFARRIARARLVFLMGRRPLGDWIPLTPGLVIALSFLVSVAARMPAAV